MALIHGNDEFVRYSFTSDLFSNVCEATQGPEAIHSCESWDIMTPEKTYETETVTDTMLRCLINHVYIFYRMVLPHSLWPLRTTTNKLSSSSSQLEQTLILQEK